MPGHTTIGGRLDEVTQLLQDFEPIHAGHLDVEEDQVGASRSTSLMPSSPVAACSTS
jgi:hypothetical protein